MQVHTKLSSLTRGTVMLIALALTSASTAQSVNITPLQSIQATINSGLYDEIVLGPGTYFQTVEFFGAAITLRSTDPTDQAVVASTIIDGQFLGDSVIRCTAGEGPDTIIDGLTIINGEALNVGGSDRGGGLSPVPGRAGLRQPLGGTARRHRLTREVDAQPVPQLYVCFTSCT